MVRFILSAILVAALAVPVGIWLEGRWREARRREQAAFELKVERELDRPISLPRISGETPTLLQVLERAAGEVDVPLVVNRAVLADHSLLDEQNFDLPETSLSFRSLLRLLSRQIPLDYYADGGRLVITSRQDAERRVTTKVYPLPQLGGPEQPFGADLDTWIEVLSVVVEPDSWDNVGGPAEIVPIPGAVIIRQTNRAHERLKQFFDKLHRDSPTPDAESDYLSSFSPAEKRIHAALEVPCDFECAEAPLSAVLDGLSRQYHIPIILRLTHLEGAAIDPDGLVSLKMRGASFRSVLQSLVEPSGLALVICDDTLQVTTEEDARSEAMAVVYDVRDLTPGGDFDSLTEVVESKVHPDMWEGRGEEPWQAMPPFWLAFRESRLIHDGTAEFLTRLRGELRARSTGLPAPGFKTSAERALAAAMERPIKLTYQRRPLREVVADLAERTGVNVSLDERSILEVGESATLITCDLPPLPLETALERLVEARALAEYPLGWCIRNESLVLTTKVKANSQHELLIVDIHDLVGSREDPNSFGDENFLELVDIMLQPRNWDGSASISSFQSLLVADAPRHITDRVRRLVAGLRKYRDESLAAARRGQDSPTPLLLDDEQAATHDSLYFRIYPVGDLLGPDGPAALESLKDAIEASWAGYKWSADGRMRPVPPAGLLVAQDLKGHRQLQEVLDEFRQHMAPGHPTSPWLAGRDQRRRELEQALQIREPILVKPQRMSELRTAVERAIKKEVALGPLYLLRGLEAVPEPKVQTPGASPTVKEQLAGLELAVVDTEHGLKLMRIYDDERLGIFEAGDLLSRRDPFELEELYTLLSSPFDELVPPEAQQHSPIRFRDWLIVRAYDQRLAEVAELAAWLPRQAELPHALQVRERSNPKETSALIRRLVDSQVGAERLYLAFVLQFAEPPDVSLEELALEMETLDWGRRSQLVARLKESLNRWVAVLESGQLADLFKISESRFLRRAIMQTLGSRALFGEAAEGKVRTAAEEMIDARKDLSADELAELRFVLSLRRSPPVVQTLFESKSRNAPPAARRISEPRELPWQRVRDQSSGHF